jgi:hypothetical protein
MMPGERSFWSIPQRSLTTWGRTGFDGDTSGRWLHAELIAS